MSKYWIANEPNSSITATQAKIVANVGRNISTTAIAVNLGKNASTIVGALETNMLILSSKVADIASYVLDITQAPVSGVITTSTTGAAGGTKITFTSCVASGVIGGYLKIRIATSAGGTAYRYLAMFTTSESS